MIKKNRKPTIKFNNNLILILTIFDFFAKFEFTTLIFRDDFDVYNMIALINYCRKPFKNRVLTRRNFFIALRRPLNIIINLRDKKYTSFLYESQLFDIKYYLKN